MNENSAKPQPPQERARVPREQLSVGESLPIGPPGLEEQHAHYYAPAPIIDQSRRASFYAKMHAVYRPLIYVIVSLAVGTVIVLVVVLVPSLIYHGQHLQNSTRISAENSFRNSLGQIVFGFAVLLGLYFTARNLALSRRGQITDQFGKAIEQLGSEDVNVRIGSLYALEQIAQSSPRNAQTVVEIALRFIRDKAGRFNDTDSRHSHDGSYSVPPDVDVALTVLGRRPYSGRERRRVNLWGIVLDGADLDYADLRNADLSYATLRKGSMVSADLREAVLAYSCIGQASLTDANAQGAVFSGAKLSYTYLLNAKLDKAYFGGADLSHAVIGGSDLPGQKPTSMKGTILTDAKLNGTILLGVDLRQVIGLTQEQIDVAVIDEKTLLPPSINRPGSGDDGAPGTADKQPN